jgi:hypothetical protein
VAAWLIAAVVRAAFLRLTKTAWLDRFVVESGLSSLFGRNRPLETAPLVAGVIYWLILLVGLLTGLNAFNTALTTKMVEGCCLPAAQAGGRRPDPAGRRVAGAVSGPQRADLGGQREPVRNRSRIAAWLCG